MQPKQLHYDPQTATRYSDPPGIPTFEESTLHLLDHYRALLQLRDAAKAQHIELVHRGVFQSIPTLTSETRNGRPGTYWRAVFRTNSPEVMAGKPRKHYIGNDETKLLHWRDWIGRTQLAIQLNQLIHDIGSLLKQDCLTINRRGRSMATAAHHYTTQLEHLTP